MLEFHPLTFESYPHYEELVMASEEIFPENIRESSEDYCTALQQEGALAFIVCCKGEYAGNVVGFPPGAEQREKLRFHEMDVCLNGLIYLFNIVAMPTFQGQGVGKQMLFHFLKQSRAAGFSRVGGHFRGNGSLNNFIKYGGTALATFDNWFDTGESYEYCELDLDRSLANAV